MKAAQATLLEALEREAEAQELLLAGERARAEPVLREVASLYRRSWDAAHPTAFGRLTGMLKAAVIAGGGEEEAAFARAEVGVAETPAAAYAVAVAALVEGDADAASAAARTMGEGDEAFARAGEAITALAARDGERYASAVESIVRDFEGREQHVTGVAIADTALMLEELAARRGLEAGVRSPLLPQR
ncbi:MAG TPA: hypothetical protein VFY99_07865 [Solirubrobacterales bacterium]